MSEPYWGKGATHRFDDPTKTFGVLYAGDSLATAFAESVIHENARFDPHKGTFQVAASEFERAVTTYAAPSGVRLRFADFSGNALKALGLNVDLCSGDDYSTSQTWAKAVHDGCPDVAGIRYPSRQHPTHLCFAVFERSALLTRDHRALYWKERNVLCELFNVETIP